jgi:hypothetical protein
MMHGPSVRMSGFVSLHGSLHGNDGIRSVGPRMVGQSSARVVDKASRFDAFSTRMP